MSHERLIRRLFTQALKLDPGLRETFLRENCSDPEIRREVMDLLRRHDSGDESPVPVKPPTKPPAPDDPPKASSRPFPTIPGFEVLEEIGKGGMGVVYRARDHALARDVAVKVLHPTFAISDAALTRFRNEGQIMAKFEHQSIVRVFTVGDHEGLHYIVSSFVEGGTLADYIYDHRVRKKTMPDPRDAAELVAMVAEALGYVHDHKVIHRDVKPSNIMTKAIEGRQLPRAMLTDFGLAKHLDYDGLTLSGQIAGTPSYMSPEQCLAKRVTIDHRTDVYSLGVVLYELLTMRTPFHGKSFEEIVRAISFTSPKGVRTYNPSVPKDLENICKKAMEKSPDDRYQSAGIFAGDLRAFLDGRPVIARPPTIARRVKEWAREHKVAALATSTVLLAGAVIGVSFYAVDRARASTTPVSVLSEDKGARIYVQRFDEETLRLGDKADAGTVPYRKRMAPGQYRFTVVATGGRIAEATVFLAEPQRDEVVVSLPVATKPGGDQGMIFVPAGVYEVGGEDEPECFKPQLIETVGFYLDKSEVSNEAYKRFVDATGHRVPFLWDESGYDVRFAKHPVTGVTWFDAQAFARWAGKRLPTSLEWEAAMRAPDGRESPWMNGSAPDVSRPTLSETHRFLTGRRGWSLASYERHVSTVDADRSPSALGFYHGATNVRELTDNIFFDRSQAAIVKGASWVDSPELEPLSASRSRPPQTWALNVGFRCARSIGVTGN